MAALDCHIDLAGNISFENNMAVYGGGLYADGSNITGYAQFINNSASKDGGGAYALRSTLSFEQEVTYLENLANSNGGGMLLRGGSKMYLQRNTHINFISNHAEQKGGALMVESFAQSPCAEGLTCELMRPTDCFFQIQTDSKYETGTPILDISELNNIRMNFNNNSASVAGAAIYGSPVDFCSLDFLNEHLYDDTRLSAYKCPDSGLVFNHITSNKSLGISTDAIFLCKCTNDGLVDCSNSTISMTVYPGSSIEIPVIASGQRNGTTPAVIRSITPKDSITFSDSENTQSTTTNCTVLKYTVQTRAVETSEEIWLYAEGLCPPRERAHSEHPSNVLTVNIKVLQCPPGFELSKAEPACICAQRLTPFTNECRIDDTTVYRDTEFWVGYTDDGNSKGLILHAHCPFDYCLSNSMYIAVDDSDQQCSNNRSGLLCGKCSRNFSLALGSSNCLQCSSNYLWLLVAFAFAGLALVFILFVLNLTVAAGTINGLIFYANILAVNSAIFYRPQTTNILTVFIAWLNLDLGIETCFYDGMDIYVKTWLQFVFPLYVWALVIAIITVSHYSLRISAMLSNSTVAVLATLVLLSYAKLLRTIISVLFYTVLEYPDNSQVAVWLLDANIKYLSGKHIPLFIATLACLIFLFLPYTLILFFGQWIQRSRWRIFSVFNNYRVLFFREAYDAPYINKHRYWTGLMLLIRCTLYLTFAFNTLGDPSINLLCIAFATSALMIFTALLGNKIYKTLFLNALELSFNSNLCLLAVTTLYIRSAGGRQNAVTFISISIAFVTFIGIIFYHLVSQIQKAPQWWKRIQPSRSDNYNSVPQTSADAPPSPVDPSDAFPIITYININELARAQLQELETDLQT